MKTNKNKTEPNSENSLGTTTCSASGIPATTVRAKFETPEQKEVMDKLLKFSNDLDHGEINLDEFDTKTSTVMPEFQKAFSSFYS